MATHCVIVPLKKWQVRGRHTSQGADVRIVADELVAFEPDQCGKRNRGNAAAVEQQVVAVADGEVLGARLCLKPGHRACWDHLRPEERACDWGSNALGIGRKSVLELHCLEIYDDSSAIIPASQPETLPAYRVGDRLAGCFRLRRLAERAIAVRRHKPEYEGGQEQLMAPAA